MPILSEKRTITKKGTTDDHRPTWQIVAEGVYRFVWASRSEIPSSDGPLFKVHRDIKPSWDNRPSCHSKAEVSSCKIGNSGGTNKWQWYTVQVTTAWWVQNKVWIQAYHIKPASSLMAYHTTPIPATGKTPSELIMGRLIRTTLPTLSKVLEPKLPHHYTVKKAYIKGYLWQTEWLERITKATAGRLGQSQTG